jgi:hypothetical protein
MDAEKLRRLFDLSGRTAIITGGTRGIGLPWPEVIWRRAPTSS